MVNEQVTRDREQPRPLPLSRYFFEHFNVAPDSEKSVLEQIERQVRVTCFPQKVSVQRLVVHGVQRVERLLPSVRHASLRLIERLDLAVARDRQQLQHRYEPLRCADLAIEHDTSDGYA